MMGNIIRVLVDKVGMSHQVGRDSVMTPVIVNQKYLTTTTLLVHNKIDVIKPINLRPIIPGDRLELLCINSNSGVFVMMGSMFDGIHEGTRTIDSSMRYNYEIDNMSLSLYHIPNMERAHYFEIKLIVVYYNPATNLTSYDVPDKAVFNLTDHPDRFEWGVFARYDGRTVCVGSWVSHTTAYKIYEYFRTALKVINRLKDD